MLGLSLASPSNTLLTASKPISANPKSSSSSSSIRGIPTKNVSFLRMPSSPSSALSSSTSSSSSVVMMAKRREELDEIRSKTTEELNKEVMDLKGDIVVLHLKKTARKDYKSSEFRRMRKKVARILTVKRERELAEGITKRYSRKLDRQWKKNIVVRPPPSMKKLKEEQAALDAEKAKGR